MRILSSSSFRRLFVAFAGAAILSVATPAEADNAGAAQVLYERAMELMQAKNYDEACLKLEEVTRLVPEGLGAKLTLAECYEADGRLASAWLQYSLVSSAAARAGQGDRERLATEKAAALKPKLAKLTIKVPAAVKTMPELAVKRGGVPVGAAQFDEPIPIDVGTHLVEATAHGKKPWKLEAKIPADGAELVVEVPILEDDPTARLTDPPKSPGPAGESGRPAWLLPAGIAVGGVGVAALAVGGVLGGLAMGKSSEATDACPDGRCSAEGNTLAKDAGTFADAATGLFIGGGVLAAGGILMIALAPWDDDAKPAEGADTARLRLRPAAGPGDIGLGLTAEF